MSGPNYEMADVRARAILWGIALLVAGMAVILALLWFTYTGFGDAYGRRDARRSTVETPAAEPPQPRLEVSATAYFEEYVRAQREKLTSYGWASKEERRARIPIERAMELLLERK